MPVQLLLPRWIGFTRRPKPPRASGGILMPFGRQRWGAAPWSVSRVTNTKTRHGIGRSYLMVRHHSSCAAVTGLPSVCTCGAWSRPLPHGRGPAETLDPPRKPDGTTPADVRVPPQTQTGPRPLIRSGSERMPRNCGPNLDDMTSDARASNDANL